MTTQPQAHHLKNYTPPEFLIEHVYLHFELNDTETVVTAILEMQRNPQAINKTADLILNGEELQLCEIKLDGKLLTTNQYQVNADSLIIYNVSNQFRLETKVKIKPQENKQLMGLYKSRNNFCTQCESQGFRRITYYLDRPDVMSRFTTAITADKAKYPMLLSNGNLIEEHELEGGRHWVKWEDPSKKPSYLFALVAGDFDLLTDTFTTLSGRPIDLRLYLEKGFKDQGDFALAALKRAMRWDEETWGREYDLDIYMIVAVSDFNMGAMENKGLNIFNTKYILAKPTTATDQDYVGIENVIGHEYFHNWSGNRITCRDWFQITLKEGLTVFRDQCFIEDMTSKGVMRIQHADIVRVSQFAEDASPMAHPIRPNTYIEINNFYTITVYRKGAEVIRMVQTILTPEVFRKGMDLYFKKFDGQAVTTEDFINAMEQASGHSLAQFQRWYSQAGTPLLTIDGQYNEHQKTFTLNVKQTCPSTPGQTEKLPFHIPLKMGLVAAECYDLPLQLENENATDSTSLVLEITEPEQTFTFINVPNEPIPSLLRGFSAPVKLIYNYSDEQLAHLWRCDTDCFSRFDAGQRLMTRTILNLLSAKNQQKMLIIEPLLLDTFSELLSAPHNDLAMQAKLLTLPPLKYLMAQVQQPNITGLFHAREFMQCELSKACENQLLALYEKHHKKQTYVYNADAMAERSLKNYCLNYLMAANEKQYAALAYEQFTTADNMTDTMGALLALNNYPVKEREEALQTFYERWKHEPLVVNKWLSLQALSTLPETLQKIQTILNSEKFDIQNPNNVYALICGFGENQIRFHADDGSGYNFMAEQAIKIDATNSIVAGRILQPLTRWSQMDNEHSNLMRQALKKVAQQPTLSKDLFEIVNKNINTT